MYCLMTICCYPFQQLTTVAYDHQVVVEYYVWYPNPLSYCAAGVWCLQIDEFEHV